MLINNSFPPILLLLLLSVFFFKIIKGQNNVNNVGYYGETNFKLKTLKDEFKVQLLNTFNDTNCPVYSSGPRIIYAEDSNSNPTGEIQFCDVNFACNGDKCIYYKSPYNTYYIKDGKQYGIPYKKEDNDNSNNNKKFFIHSCTMQNEFCFSEGGCIGDDECFSRNCKQGRCVVNKDKSIYLCRIKRKLTDELYVECKLNVNEFCIKNDKCYTNKCNPNYQLCYDENADYKIKFQKFFYVFIGIILIFALSCVLYLYNFKEKLFSHFETQTEASIDMNEINNSNSPPGRTCFSSRIIKFIIIYFRCKFYS